MRDLIVTIDDATSAIYSAFLTEQEGAASSFRDFGEVFGKHGLATGACTDRGSHCFVTPEAGGKVDKANLTQPGRALAHPGVEHIAAWSPQARGRPERVFLTLQDRLAGEPALAGRSDIDAADIFIRDVHIPARDKLFAG